MSWVYYLKENAVLRAPGPDRLPTEVLWHAGWKPYPKAPPNLWDRLDPVSLDDARAVARAAALPTDDWDAPSA